MYHEYMNYELAYSDSLKRTVYYVSKYSVDLCKAKGIDLEYVPAVIYQILDAIASGGISYSDIHFVEGLGIQNISHIKLRRDGSVSFA